MKLHGFDRKIAMADAHDDSIFALSRYLQARRKCLAPGEQRVVASNFKACRQSFENTFTLMNHNRRFTVHRIVEHAQFAAKRLNDSLQPQANSEHRNSGTGSKFHYVRNAEVGRTSWPWRHQNEVRR